MQVRTFFVNYRRKYNLDNILKEYEQEAATKQQQQLQQQRQKLATISGSSAAATAIGDAETNKEQKPPNSDSTNGDSHNLSMDSDVMEVCEWMDWRLLKTYKTCQGEVNFIFSKFRFQFD